MKRFFIFVGMMLATVCAQAQLRVIENGNISVFLDGIRQTTLCSILELEESLVQVEPMTLNKI